MSHGFGGNEAEGRERERESVRQSIGNRDRERSRHSIVSSLALSQG